MASTEKFEFPRRAVPGYLHAVLGDYYDPQDKWYLKIPPGHRFLLYFHGLASTGRAQYEKGEKDRKRALQKAAEDGDWRFFEQELKKKKAELSEERVSLKDKKILALKAASNMGIAAEDLLEALSNRRVYHSSTETWIRPAELTSPLLTGSGNPHPVENGFAFLSPYGVPYLAGSGVKGVIRRAAEELTLLHGDAKGWNLVLVWVLFGFDAMSAAFQEEGDLKGNPFAVAYRKKVSENLSREEQALLAAWIWALGLDCSSVSVADFLTSLSESKKLRERIHWQGLVCFSDALPERGAQLGVDILNPHHRSYYQGEESPHDADQPLPVYFLVLKPGARFTFRAALLRGRKTPQLMEHIENWKVLLDRAFDHACHWLGFGAKTAVGYGAMRPALRSAQADTTKPETEKEESAIQRASTEAGAALCDRPSDKRSSTVGASSVRSAKWPNVTLTWNPGKGEVSCTFEGNNAFSSDKNLLSSSLMQKLKKKGTARANVEVELIGGKNHRIVKIIEPD